MVAGAKAIAELIARREPIKAWFNVAQWALATAIGALVLDALRHDDDPTSTLLTKVLVASVVVVAVNHAALVVVLAIVGRRSAREVLRELRPVIVTGWIIGGLLTLALGVLIAASTAAAAETAPLVLVPLVMLHLASKQLARERAGRHLRRASQDAAVDAEPSGRSSLRDRAVHAHRRRRVRRADRCGSSCSARPQDRRTCSCSRQTIAAWNIASAPRPMSAELATLTTAVAVGARDDGDLTARLPPGWRQVLVAPIRSDSAATGVLYVIDPQGFERDPYGDLAALESIAAGAASALARAEMLDRIISVHRQSELLLVRESRALESIAAGDDLATSLAEIAGFVDVGDPGARTAVVIWPELDARAAGPSADPTGVRRRGRGVIGGDGPALPRAVVEELREDRTGPDVTVVADVGADRRWTDADDAWQRIGSWWGAPIDAAAPHGVIGVISVSHLSARRAPDDAERLALRVAQRLARLAVEQTVSRDELMYQARHDVLTGVANRAAFLEATQRATARSERTGRPFAVLFVDLDRFKYVNDTMGHDAGDALLVSVAARLRSLVRTPDAVARHGGDEFTVLSEDLRSDADALGLAERVLAALDDPARDQRHGGRRHRQRRRVAR